MAEDEPETLDEGTLVDQLASAVNRLRQTTCDDMVPLWLHASRRIRGRLEGTAFGTMGFEPSKKYRSLSAGNQSNYRALASWRQVVIWKQLLETPRPEGTAREASARNALTRMYFTPFPANVPPYAFSRKAPDDPLVTELGGPGSYKDHARRGAAEMIGAIADLEEESPIRNAVDVVAADLIGLGAKDSLWNTLKAERFRKRSKKEST